MRLPGLNPKVASVSAAIAVTSAASNSPAPPRQSASVAPLLTVKSSAASGAPLYSAAFFWIWSTPACTAVWPA
ncbi:MAG: hypothetical protein BWX70_03044 [Verrucomicrobia bacterium ADurb.Bin070]|nr:MAG: hypothetical protein BWX70_03044 [Verrucomicrobia bacterium ADurb.Bin070]